MNTAGTKRNTQHKHTIDELKKFSFRGKNPKEKDLSRKIDEIVYLGK